MAVFERLRIRMFEDPGSGHFGRQEAEAASVHDFRINGYQGFKVSWGAGQLLFQQLDVVLVNEM